MASFTVKRLAVILALLIVAWNIITAFDECVDNLYFKITKADKTDPKHWFIIGLLGSIVLGVMLYFINMDAADVFGVTVRPGLRVNF